MELNQLANVGELLGGIGVIFSLLLDRGKDRKISNSGETMPIYAVTGSASGIGKAVAEIDGQSAYGGGKQALGRWMRHLSPAAAKSGVRINAIAPGYTETGMTKSGLADPRYREAIQQFVNSIPVGRAGLPEDQANAVAFLLSENASFISGSVLFVDGGHDATFRPDRF
ncbi:MAG: SDR family oxidoreductase [Halieaceae bacterium]